MNETEIDLVCKRAIEHFGKMHQIKKCMEELHELYNEFTVYRVDMSDEFVFDDKIDQTKIIDEIADVFITIFQMVLIFDGDAIGERVEFKLDRLQDRMNKRDQDLKND